MTSTGGIEVVWKYLLEWGFYKEGFECLKIAWNEYNDGVEDIDESTHRKLAKIAFNIEDELNRALELFHSAVDSHPEIGTISKLKKQIKQFQKSMGKEADVFGLKKRERRFYFMGNIYHIRPEPTNVKC